MKHRLGLLILAAAAAIPHARALQPTPIRVVVVTTFELGKDTGDMPGEFQTWVERYPLTGTLPFPQGYRTLRYNPADQVLGIVTGVGKSHAAASIMALGMDPRFDLTRAYWILAGIAGIDPAKGSVGSAAWANYVVDGDLAYEIDGREIPRDWSTGIVPNERATPYEQPVPTQQSIGGVQLYHLNEGPDRLGLPPHRRHPPRRRCDAQDRACRLPHVSQRPEAAFCAPGRHRHCRPLLDRRQDDGVEQAMDGLLDQGQRNVRHLGRGGYRVSAGT